ncbi:hypothetical protein HaLaN_24580 [Haematococcus lacustris]|uniref:Uncharacterized protein n=1 Tax=Haematococcus lacustris TaxID=44745 RepID=A0A699ZUR7_HAELA|nr:hypothetical protein HaLaN_24580 [Haematococcus lacustris]
MQVLITVLESHGKLRLLPDGTRGSALKDYMHGVIHYPSVHLVHVRSMKVTPSNRAFSTPRPNLNLVKLLWCHVIDANAIPMLEPYSIRASLPMHRLRQFRVSLKPNPTPPPPFEPLDFHSLGA